MKEKFSWLFKKDENFRGLNYYFDKHPVMVLFYTLLTIVLVLLVSFTIINFIMVILVSSDLIVQPVENNLAFYYLAKLNVSATSNPSFIYPFGQFLLPAIYTDIFGKHSFIMSVADYIVRVSPAILFFLYFRKILFTAINNSPFDKKNVARLRIVGLIFLVSPIIILLVVSVFNLTGFSRTIISFSSQRKISVSYGINNFWQFLGNIQFLFGAFTLVVAEVFKLGINLKEENDLTV